MITNKDPPHALTTWTLLIGDFFSIVCHNLDRTSAKVLLSELQSTVYFPSHAALPYIFPHQRRRRLKSCCVKVYSTKSLALSILDPRFEKNQLTWCGGDGFGVPVTTLSHRKFFSSTLDTWARLSWWYRDKVWRLGNWLHFYVNPSFIPINVVRSQIQGVFAKGPCQGWLPSRFGSHKPCYL